MERMKYSDHVDILVALVTHLGMTRYKSRLPSKIAKYLDIDEGETVKVLENFKGLFRKSIGVSSHGEHYYTLQLRYARRWLDQEKDKDQDGEEEEEPREPIGAEYLSALLNFIISMVVQEQSSSRQLLTNRITLYASIIAAVAAIIAAIISFIN